MQDVINRLRNKKDDEGFTLIELLVVVVIIGVLVAIAVPVYLNYRKGAADKSAQSDVRGAVSTIEQYYTDNGNSYPNSTGGYYALKTASFSLYGTGGSSTGGATAGQTGGWITLSDKTTLTYKYVDASSYLVCASNSGGSGKVYLYDSKAGGSVKTAAVKVDDCTTAA